MLAERDAIDVVEKELGQFPLSLGTYEVSFRDSSASGSFLGLANKKAIYRKGLGCTLVNEMSEAELRQQKVVLAQRPHVDTDTIPWPMGDKLPDSLPVNFNIEKMKAVVEEAFMEPGPDKLRRTRAILVVYDGQIVVEKYADGFDRTSLHHGWSMTKSITNALVGILVRQGRLDINQPAPISLWKNDERKKITINNLLHASSGLDWKEVYAGPSDATIMLFRKGNAGLFAADHPLSVQPETDFYYSSGSTNILSWIIRQTVGDTAYYAFPSKELFYKLGMYNTVIEPDAGGTLVGSSFSFATARDWARFGLLYLNNGNYNGEQLLPENWVQYTVTPAVAAEKGEYGAQFWLNAGAPGNPADRYFPDVPSDLFWADGYEGQNVFILPSRKLVVVKLSLSQGDYLDDNRFLADLLTALR
jgi:CubicO group peptidase (beta-lactamase class C family)